MFDTKNYVELLDLLAQQSMAASTEWILLLGLLQLVATCAGTLAIIWTLRSMIRSTNAAVSAAETSLKLLSAERAWLVYAGGHTEGEIVNSNYHGKYITKGVYLNLSFRNLGRTAAIDVRAVVRYEFDTNSERTGPDRSLLVTGPASFVASEQTFEPKEIALDDAESHLFRSNQSSLYIDIALQYRDVFSHSLRESRYLFFAQHITGTYVVGGKPRQIVVYSVGDSVLT